MILITLLEKRNLKLVQDDRGEQKEHQEPSLLLKALTILKNQIRRSKTEGIKLQLILIIVFAILIAGFVFEELTFNFLGTRDITRDLFIKGAIWIDPELSTMQEVLQEQSDERQAALDEREKEIEEREAEVEEQTTILDAREAALDTRTAQLDRRAAEQDKRQEELDLKEDWLTPLYRRDMTEQELADMISLSRTYSQMAPESASAILVELFDPHDVAAILYFMTERNAAPILAAMTTDYAARITEILLNN